MELIKVVFIGIVVSVVSVILKQIKPEYSLFAIIIGGIIILVYIINSFTNIFSFFSEVVNKTGIDGNLFKILLKIIGIGYLVEFSVGICNDSGHSSIGDKVALAGKILIFIVSMPIVANLFNIILELL
ncbi:MAG: stage III sporulation protein AD [Clostridiales bacterium]|nr:stage III sporulation protein AD [Clostridiales bacterium]